MDIFIKYYFLIFCALYAYLCMLKSHYRHSDIKVFHLIFPAVLSFLTYFIYICAAPIRIPGMLFLSFVVFTITFHIPWKVSASATLLSFGCSYLFFTVSALLMSVVEVLLSMWFDCSKMKLIFAFFIGLLQILGTVCLFRIRRFSRGLSFLWELGGGYTGLFISISILTAASFLSLNNDTHFIYFVLFFSILIWGIALLFWWRERITKKYIDQINARAAKELEAAISARDLEIAYLKEQGILSVFHYIPLHSAPAGLRFGRFHGEDKYTTRESERLARLPMYYGLDEDKADYICDTIKAFYA